MFKVNLRCSRVQRAAGEAALTCIAALFGVVALSREAPSVPLPDLLLLPLLLQNQLPQTRLDLRTTQLVFITQHNIFASACNANTCPSITDERHRHTCRRCLTNLAELLLLQLLLFQGLFFLFFPGSPSPFWTGRSCQQQMSQDVTQDTHTCTHGRGRPCLVCFCVWVLTDRMTAA